MRWLAVVLVCAFVCSVKTQDDEDSFQKPFLRIVSNPTMVFYVGEMKAIFCNSSYDAIEWISPSKKVVEKRSSKNTRVFIEKMSSQYGLPLIIHQVKISDAGNWTCKAEDLNDTVEIIVGEKAIITDRNVEMDGDEGKAVRITCETKGYPPPVIAWYKENLPITSDGKKYIVREDHSLEIKKLDHMDVGTYVCKVRQRSISHYTEKNAHLTVRHKPILYNINTQAIYYNKYKTEEIYAIMNETKNITCSALANPKPTYHWYRREDSYDSDEITDPDMVVTSPDGSVSVLMLRMDNETVLGQYKCSSKNIKGSESIVFHVTLGTKPDPPDFVAVATPNVTEIVFNVSCSTCPMVAEDDVAPNPENLTVTGYVFELVEYKEHFEPDWDAALHFEVKIENENVTLFTVGGLNNDTKYHVRVASVNAAGYSEWYVATDLAKTTAHAFRLAASLLLIVAASMLILHY